MEHLFFYADSPDETKSACLASSLSMDWETKTEPEWQDFILPKTPWLAFNHDELSIGSFLDYPKMADFDVSSLWNAKFRDTRQAFADLPGDQIGRQVAAFFQSWLFFGLLESIIEKKINTSYFVRQNYIYTRNLHFCLQSQVFASRKSPETKARINRDIQINLRLVQGWINHFIIWSHPSFKPKVDAEYPRLVDHLEDIIPAIVRLAEALEQTRLYISKDEDFIGTLTWNYPFRAIKIRQESLSRLGWCSFQIRFLEDTLNQSTLDWIVATGLKQDSIGHEMCTAELCARNDVDSDTYEQAHVCEDMQCEKLKPCLSDVMAILERDEIPVMCLEKEGKLDRLVVAGISKTDPGPFVAISHVWADGLGGKTEEGLNKCQALRVATICASVQKTQEKTWFWLDCLCIPRDCSKEIYYKALDAIKDVYRYASSVLVMDKTIERCAMGSQIEILYARIYLSAWMQRMWTYEEAVLSRELVFALGDGLHKYKHNTEASMRQTTRVVWQSLSTQLFRLRADSERLSIGHVYKSFRYRLCNVPQDEFISVAGMLGMDTMTLLQMKGEERTKDFWLMLKWVPCDVVFLDGPRLSIPKFGWAPRTLMHPSRTALDTKVTGDKAECTENGLVGKYLAVQLNRTLFGEKQSTRSIFYIWMEGIDQSARARGDHRALLRVYCTEFWPADGANFNMVVLPSYLDSIMEQGQLSPGGALYHEEHGMQNGHAVADPEFRYVGRVLVERLTNEELVQRDGTITFEGSSRRIVSAQGNWVSKEVHII